MKQQWQHILIGIIFLIFGIGGIVASFVGHTSLPARYFLGGVFFIVIGVGNLLRLRQKDV